MCWGIKKMKLKIKTKFVDESDYPKENRKYYTSGGPKERLTQKLFDSCRGFCMYCGKKLVIESDYRYQIEHAVDKDGNIHQEIDSNEVLKHCKFNLAISCPECNQVCKKVVDKIDLSKYESLDKCPSKCTKICEKYGSIRAEYEKKNAIILQPLGAEGIGDTAIVYNLLDHTYEPSEEISDANKLFLIQNHIDRFRLNGNRFSTSVIDLCGQIVKYIDYGISEVDNIFEILDGEKVENVIGEEFITFIKMSFKDSSSDRLIDFCKLLIVLDAVS